MAGEVACRPVRGTVLGERRAITHAAVLGVRAPSVESTPRWRVSGARNVPDEEGMLAAPLDVGIRDQDRLDEGSRVRVQRALLERVGGKELDYFPEVHDRYARAQLERGCEVMSDEDVGTAELCLQVVEERHDLGLKRDIQGTERLVQDDERRICDERSRDAGTLLLAA